MADSTPDVDINLGNEWVSITTINDETVEKFKEYTLQLMGNLDADDLNTVTESRRQIQELFDRIYEEVTSNTFEEDDLLHVIRVLREKNMKFIELGTKILESKLDDTKTGKSKSKAKAKSK